MKLRDEEHDDCADDAEFEGYTECSNCGTSPAVHRAHGERFCCHCILDAS